MTEHADLRLRFRIANPVPDSDTIDAEELDRILAAIESEWDEVRGLPSVARVRTRYTRSRPVGVLVFATALLAVVLAIGVPILFFSGGDSMTVDQPATTLPLIATTVPATTVANPPVTTPSVDEPPPADDAAVVPEAGFDYESIGEAEGTLDTAFGTLSWYQTSSVPRELVEAGLPGPSRPRPDYDLRRTFAKAPCCLEVFEGADGYLGLGATGGPDEPRIIFGHRGDLLRVRGVETVEEFEILSDTTGIDGFEYWSEWYGRWDFYTGGGEFSFAPAEVWFTPDGSTWEQRADSAFGTDVVMLSQPDSVAERDGTWMVLGWSGIEDPASSTYRAHTVGGIGTAWTSDDLKTWTLVPFEFGSPGVDTNLLSVVAGDGGWMVVGERISRETPATHEPVVWISPDGLAWSELPMADVVGLPHCGSSKPTETCLSSFLRAAFFPDGITLYVEYGDPSVLGWRLWIGVWED